jgi:hypothetical protein
MKSYYGNYLGVVITGGDKDPEHRGRTQVFVPNIMPALYENWNEPGEDITFEVIGQGLDGSLNPQIIDRLRNTLPWAECAAPITGAAPSYGTGVGGFVSETIRNVGKAAEAVGDFIGDVKDRVFGGVQDSGVDFTKDQNAWSGAFISYAAGAGDPSFPRNLKHTNYAAAVRDGKSANWEAVDPRTTELKPGDIVINNRGRGNFNYSDFQNGKTDGASSHGDVVVSVSGGTAKVVGGNVSNKVAGYSVNARGGGGAFVVLRPKSQEIANKVAGNATNELGNWQKNGWSEGSSSARDTLNAYWQAGQSGKPFPDTALAGQPNVSPSALPNPQPATGMQPDPTKEQEAAAALDGQQKVDLGMQSSPEQMSLDGSLLAVGSNGKVDPNNMKAYLEQRLASSPLTQANNGKGYVPADAAKYGVDGSAKSWANYLTKLAEKESGFNAGQTYKETAMAPNSKGETILSSGLFQVSYESVRGYGVGKGLSDTELQQKLFDPAFNIDAAIAIHEKQVLKHGKIEMESGKGAGGYFAKRSMEKIKTDVAAGKVDSFDASAAASSPIATNQPIVQNPTPHHGVSGPNTNNQALGMFGYASEGQAVWVFFREGNPLFPVYFAASYGNKEWGNMYQNASNAFGSGTPGTLKMQSMFYGGGFNSSLSTNESEVGQGHSFQLFDNNGSNLTFAKDHTQFNAMYNHVQRVMGDSHDITETNKEVRVKGNYNTFTEQDMFITIGNWTDDAIAASDEIQSYINQAMEIKAAAGKSGGGESTSAEQQSNNTTATETTTPPENTYKPTDYEKEEYSKALAKKKNNLDAAAEWKNSSDPELKSVYDSAKKGYDTQLAINKSKNIT